MNNFDLKLDQTNESERSRKSARTISLMVATASVVTCIGWYANGVIYFHWYFTAFICICFVVLTRFYRQMPTWASGGITVLSLILPLIATTLTNYQLSQSGLRFEAYASYKLVPLAVALIAPSPIWLGYIIIGACAVIPYILYYLVFSIEQTSSQVIQEPWYTLIFSIIAFFVLYHRRRGIENEKMMTRMQAERRALDDLARIFLGMRDLTNTPLQSIELTAQLLKTNNLTTLEGSEHLERSLVRLRELSLILTSYEKDVNWTQTESSFDPVILLQNKISEMKRR